MNILEGWIKVYRKLLDDPVACKDSDYLAVWIYLLTHATHKKYETIFKNERIFLLPGQLITGRKAISKKFKVSESKVQRILKTFEIEQQIEQVSSNQNRLITILKWDLYQQSEQENEQPVNNERTTNEQPVNTNKNVKNIKNVKNKDIKNNVAAEARHDESSVYFKCAFYMRSKIFEINPNSKLPGEDPDSLDKWSDDIRKILVLDKRELDELRALVNYVYEVSDFWNSVIQSPAGLRKHWDKISNQMTSVKPKSGKKAQNIQGGNYSTLSNNDLENMLTKKRESLRNEVG